MRNSRMSFRRGVGTRAADARGAIVPRTYACRLAVTAHAWVSARCLAPRRPDHSCSRGFGTACHAVGASRRCAGCDICAPVPYVVLRMALPASVSLYRSRARVSARYPAPRCPDNSCSRLFWTVWHVFGIRGVGRAQLVRRGPGAKCHIVPRAERLVRTQSLRACRRTLRLAPIIRLVIEV